METPGIDPVMEEGGAGMALRVETEESQGSGCCRSTPGFRRWAVMPESLLA
jgi:hypothetical protein